MRGYRTGYFSAPCNADRRCKTSYVYRRINVGVPLVSARTGEKMLNPFSNFPAHATCLRRVGGVNVNHGQSNSLGFVGYKVLKLSESPTMQSRPDPLPGLDVGTDVGQIFHTNFTRTGTDGFCNNGLAGFVVDALHMPLLTTGDSAELAFSSPATVGLETTTMGKVNIPVMPEFPATPDLAGAGGCEVILANVKPESATTRNGRDIGNVEDEIEVPDAFAKDQFCFLRDTIGEKIDLMLTGSKWNALASSESEQRDGITFDRIGALIEADGRSIKANRRNRIILGNAFVSIECLVRIGNAVYGLAHHLATQCRKQFADGIVSKVVKRHAVPATIFNRKWNNGIASGSKNICQNKQRRRLLGGCQQLQRYGAFVHIGIIQKEDMECQA